MILKTKKCSKCGQIKSINEFGKNKRIKSGLSSWCKDCLAKYNKQWHISNPKYYKQYYIDNLEERKEYNRQWYIDKSEKVKECHKRYYINNLKQFKEKHRQWRKNNPGYQKQRLLNPTYKLSKNISNLIYLSLKGNKNGWHWEIIVNYTLKDLIAHLENQFREGMTWDNYGKYGWHIDHRRPISSFNFTSYNDPEFKECWALKNLQPLWAKENLSKGNRAYG
jgi:hypothetical protein